MDRLRLFAPGLAMLLSAVGYSNDLHAAELCHAPTPKTLINWYRSTHPHQPLHYDPKNSAIYHPVATLRTTSPQLTWIGLAWLSPVSGALFAADCDGKPLAAISEGAIGKLIAGPTLPGLGETVMVEYVDHETADCVHDSIGIMALHDGKIISLWKHDDKQGMNVVGSGKALHGFVSRNYAVNFDSAGQMIRVTGKLVAYLFLKDGSQSATPSATQILPAESYRWDAKKLRFMPEGKYRHFTACLRSDWPNLK
jgi:hypothetical protein